MDYSFRLLFAFVSMCRSWQAHFFLQVSFSKAHVCTCTQPTRGIPSTSRLENADEEKLPTRGTVCTRGTDTFYILAGPELLSHTLTLRWQPPALREHTKLVHICMQRPRSQSILAADSGFHFGPCAVRFIESGLHGVLLRITTELHLSTGTQHQQVTPRIVNQAYAYAPSSSQPSRASKPGPGWPTEKIKIKK